MASCESSVKWAGALPGIPARRQVVSLNTAKDHQNHSFGFDRLRQSSKERRREVRQIKAARTRRARHDQFNGPDFVSIFIEINIDWLPTLRGARPDAQPMNNDGWLTILTQANLDIGRPCPRK